MKRTQADSRTGTAETLDHETESRIIEALIFVSDAPLTLDQISQVIPGRTPTELRALVDDLDRELRAAERAIRIEEVAGGFRFVTRPEYATWVRIHFRNRNRARLSPAGVETLAVIAYKQPVTAPEIQEIRGVDSQGPIRTLIEKRLVRIAGKKKVVGRPFLYATTKEFLMHFGLASIEDLPPIEDFEALAGTLEPDQAPAGTLTGDEGARPEVEFAGDEDGPDGPGVWGRGGAGGEPGMEVPPGSIGPPSEISEEE